MNIINGYIEIYKIINVVSGVFYSRNFFICTCNSYEIYKCVFKQQNREKNLAQTTMEQKKFQENLGFDLINSPPTCS